MAQAGNISIKPIVFAIGFGLCLGSPVLSGGLPSGTLHLLVGHRIKVEGKDIEGSDLVADEIEIVAETDDTEIEGRISSLDVGQRTFDIALYRISMPEDAEIENSQRESRVLADLVEGIRVKVKIRKWENRVIEARSVRIYEGSSDQDLEIVAVVEGADQNGSRLTLLSTGIRLTSKTQYTNVGILDGSEFLDSPERRGIRRDDDEPDLAPIRIGRLLVGGKVSLLHEERRDFDFDRDDEDRLQDINPGAQMELSAPLGEYSEAYAKFSLNRTFGLGDETGSKNSLQASLREAFLYWGNVFHPALALQVGRQRMRDKREWLYDDQLDAARLHIIRPAFNAELAVAKRLFRPTGKRSDQLYLIARTEFRLPGRHYLGGYFIKRNDLMSRDEDPIWFGLSSRGRVSRNLEYWTEVSRMMGRRRRHLLRGYAYDLGANYRFRVPLQPSLGAGYAFGSGDKNFRDGVDGNFRQTDLQDNSHRIFGLKRYRYYGVLSEPELFNMKIWTLQVGFRPSRVWSLDFIYHTYRQVVATDDLGGIELEVEPGGKDPRLGQEFDVVFAFRKTRRFDFYVFGGLYVPGPSYEERDRAILFRPEFRYFF